MRGYAVGLWAVAATRILSICLYALQDTRTPAVGNATAFVAQVVFSLMLMGQISLAVDAGALAHLFASVNSALVRAHWGVAGLALATSLSAAVNLLFQAIFLQRRVGDFPWPAWFSSLAWSVAGCGVMALPLWWIAQQAVWVGLTTSLIERMVILTFAILTGSVGYFAVAWRGGKHEFRMLVEMLPQRALRLLPQFLQPRR